MHMRYQDKDESEIPPTLLNEPELLPGLEIYYSAFWDLFSDRQLGMGVGPIPYSAMRAYCLDWEMDDEQASDLKRLVRKMDHVFLEWQEKQSKKSKKVGK
jgi:hypothetical protein